MKEEFSAHDMATAAADGFRDGQRAANADAAGPGYLLECVMSEYIEVSAEVRYWEDATINGVSTEDGAAVPLKQGSLWCPVIRLVDGRVMNWPEGTTADIHFKVCDQGEYWLLDAERARVAEWIGDYVPDDFLCPTSNGLGDYIILKIGADGVIEGWKRPAINSEEWK